MSIVFSTLFSVIFWTEVTATLYRNTIIVDVLENTSGITSMFKVDIFEMNTPIPPESGQYVFEFEAQQHDWVNPSLRCKTVYWHHIGEKK